MPPLPASWNDHQVLSPRHNTGRKGSALHDTALRSYCTHLYQVSIWAGYAEQPGSQDIFSGCWIETLTPDSSTSPPPGGSEMRGRLQSPVRCVLRQQRRRRGFLKKLGKIPGVRASENASTTNAGAGDRRPCAVPAFPAGSAGRCGWVYGWACVPQGSRRRRGWQRLQVLHVPLNGGPGLAILDIAASVPPFPGPWADQQPSRIGIDRSVPASPDRPPFSKSLQTRAASLHTHIGKVARPNGGSSSSPGLESSKGRMA
jgi:hypothetical protein